MSSTKSLWQVLLLATLLVACVGRASAGNTANQDSFEDGDFSSSPQWTELNDGTNTVKVDKSGVKSGSYSLTTTGDGSDDFGQAGVKRSFSNGDIPTDSKWNVWMRKGSKAYGAKMKFDTSGGGYIQIRTTPSSGIELNTDKGTGGTIISSYSADKWYRYKLVVHKDVDEVDAYIYDSSGNLLGSVTGATFTGDVNVIKYFENDDTTSTETTYWDLAAYDRFNSLPQFNSTSISPDPPKIGKNVSYSAEPDDPDGNNSNLNTTLTVFDDGSQVYQDSQTGTPVNWSDVYEATEGDLNAQFVTEDEAGATTTEWINRTLTDDAPQISISSPSNSTTYDYDKTVDFSVSDSDSKPSEEHKCDVLLDSSLIDEANVTEGNSYSNSFRAGLGSHNLTVECKDPAGNKNSSSVFHTIENFRIDNIRADSPVYETDNEGFESDFYNGDMVDNVTAELYWNGSQVSEETVDSTGEGNYYSDQIHTIPLVSQNNTEVNWSYSFKVNYNTESGSKATETVNSSDHLQSIYWSYSVDSSQASETDIIEGEKVNHLLTLSNRSDKADLNASLKFDRYNEANVSEISSVGSGTVTFNGTVYSGRVSSTSRTDTLNTTVKISFQNRSRSLSRSDSVTTHQLRLNQKCGGSAATGIEFRVYNEKNRDQLLNTTMTMAIQYWKDPSVKRTFNTSSESKKVHKLCFKPSWAEFTVDSTEKLIQYQDVNENYRLRSYFLIDRKVTNSTDKIALYDIKSSESTRIAFKTEDDNGEAIPEVIIKAERYFPAVDKSLSVAMLRTGSDGRSETFLEVNEIYYGFKFYRENSQGDYVLVKEAPDQIISQDLLTFTVSSDERISYYEFEQGISHTCELNATQVSCSYSTDNPIDKVELTVEEYGVAAYTTACEKKATTTSATLTCDGLNASDKNFRYDLTAYTTEGDALTLETGSSGNQKPSFGDAGVFMSAAFFLVLSLAGVTGNRPVPEIAVALSSLAIVISFSLGLLGITYQAAATFVILGIITLYKMRSEDFGGGL